MGDGKKGGAAKGDAAPEASGFAARKRFFDEPDDRQQHGATDATARHGTQDAGDVGAARSGDAD